MRVVRITSKIFVYVFALIGFILVAGFFGVKYGFTKVKGDTDKNNIQYEKLSEEIEQKNKAYLSSDIYQKEIEQKKILCQINVVSYYSSSNAKKIMKVYEDTQDDSLALKMLFAVNIRLDERVNYKKDREKCQNEQYYKSISATSIQNRIEKSEKNEDVFAWINSEDWQVVEAAISKDKDKILVASDKAGIDPRLVVSSCIVEQLRLYYTQREYYEKFFKPLQILGNANKMAWGVMSIKEKTATKIEENLKNKNSEFYLGEKYESILDFKTNDQSNERYIRLTDEKDHYYSYLYGGLYMNQIIKQWDKAEYNISNRPEIIGTLFNLGFDKSVPKENPVVGGSIIEVDGVKYTFGSLSYEFYYSGELSDIFPLESSTTGNKI